MTIQAIIESLLEKEIGLSAEAIGSETISKAIYRRMNACGLYDAKEYINHLLSSQKELENLIEMSVIPETWFFRNKESFAFLARYVRNQWLTENRDNELRILSIPCSTGEEPYSIAMTLMDTGLMNEIGRNRLYIEARDISSNSLRKARLGIYGKESFRGKNLSFRDRHFDLIRDSGGDNQNYKWQIKTSIRNMIRFKRENLVDDILLSPKEKPYHIIFCRNLLIYLSEPGKRRAVKKIESLLSKNGVLFVGHVERSFVCGSGGTNFTVAPFSWIRRPGVFACQRSDAGSNLRPEPANRSPEAVQRKFGKTYGPNIKSAKTPQVLQTEKSVGLGGDSITTHTAAGSNLRPEPASGGISASSSNTTSHEKKNGFNFIQDPGDSDVITTDFNADNLLDSARKFADQGDLYEALKICEKCLTENSFHIQAHFLMGLICHALDDEEQAEEYFNKAVYLDPNHYEALSHLAFIMEHRGDKNRADHLRQRAQRILQREER